MESVCSHQHQTLAYRKHTCELLQPQLPRGIAPGMEANLRKPQSLVSCQGGGPEGEDVHLSSRSSTLPGINDQLFLTFALKKKALLEIADDRKVSYLFYQTHMNCLSFIEVTKVQKSWGEKTSVEITTKSLNLSFAFMAEKKEII